MKTCLNYLKLVRIQNLLIIALLLYFVRYFLILPFYELEFLDMQFDNISFLIFVLGYVLLTAGGYAINDYYDIGIDEINKPNKTILRKEIPLNNGKYAYFILTAIGFLLSIWAILRIEAPKLIFVLLIITFLYWFYTTKYKREFLSGNIAVAFLAFIGVGITWLYEFFSAVETLVIPIKHIGILTRVIVIYALFSFVLTFIREIIKDITDIEGDKEFNCSTIPIKYGVKKTKIVIYFLYFILFLIFIPALDYAFQKNMTYLIAFAIMIIIMLFFSLYKLIKASSNKDFKFLEEFIKIIFLAGIFSMQLFSLNF